MNQHKPENDINISSNLIFSEKNKEKLCNITDLTDFTFSKDLNKENKQNNNNINTSNFLLKDSEIKNNDNKTFLNKKRKYMTSEEIELEQIEKERKEMKEMIRKNMALYQRMNNIQIKKVIPAEQKTDNKQKIEINNFPNKNNGKIFNNNNLNLIKENKKGNNYVVNYLKKKELVTDINKTNSNNKNFGALKENNDIIKEKKKEIIEEINTDIVENKIGDKANDKEKNIELNEEINEEENGDKKIENNDDIKNNDNKGIIQVGKSPNKNNDKESLYLKKMKELGNLSKLDLCKKIEKYTEICQEVLKQQEKRNKTE